MGKGCTSHVGSHIVFRKTRKRHKHQLSDVCAVSSWLGAGPSPLPGARNAPGVAPEAPPRGSHRQGGAAPTEEIRAVVPTNRARHQARRAAHALRHCEILVCPAEKKAPPPRGDSDRAHGTLQQEADVVLCLCAVSQHVSAILLPAKENTTILLQGSLSRAPSAVQINILRSIGTHLI